MDRLGLGLCDSCGLWHQNGCCYESLNRLCRAHKRHIDAAVLNFALRKFSTLCSFGLGKSTVSYSSLKQSVCNEESNNLNWEPVDNMVPELWSFFYRHARQKIYWAHLAIRVHV